MNAKVVLSFSWRYGFTKQENIITPKTIKCKKLIELFNNYGIDIYDITSIGNNREEEINMWLSNNNVTDFIIIDDEPNMFNKLIDKVVKTSKVKDNEMLMNMDDCIGLSQCHIDYSIKMLNTNVKKLYK